MLTLIDGNSLLFRAYYGVHSRLTRADGTPTGAVYGFMNMILPVLATANPNDSFVCVFDASRISFRQSIYPEYKANRDETPADLITQSFMVRECMSAIGMPVLCIPGVEADDVIATLSRQFCDMHDKTRIITSDKDLMQLVSHCVFLYDGMKQTEIHDQQVFEKFGVKPSQVIDAQSLIGDTADNVPGVHGIGPKKAAELLTQFGTLDGIYEHIDDIKNERIRNMLITERDKAYLSKKLVTLKDYVDLTGLKITPFVFNTPAALEYVKNKIESSSLADKIQKLFPIEKYDASKQSSFEYMGSACPTPESVLPATTIESKLPPQKYQSITNIAQLDEFLSHIKTHVAIDTETTGIDTMTAKIVGLSIAYDSCHGAYIPLHHIGATTDLFGGTTTIPDQLDETIVFKKLMPILQNPNIVKFGHNMKYDLHILANSGLDISQIKNLDDTMLLSYILHGTLHGHSLDELAEKYLNHKNIHFASLFPPEMPDANRNFATLEIAKATPYAAEDATVCFALYDLMRPELDKNKKLCDLYEKCDRPLLPVLVMMERNGVLVNRDGLKNLSSVFHTQLENLQNEIWTLAGHEFNIASPKQLGAVLFDELNLTPNKKRSTDAETLNELIDEHPIIEKILSWRSIAKLAGTYADALPKQIGNDGRIHTTYLQTSTNTGRLSSRDPNLQNIPAKTDLGAEIRRCFVAPSGRVLISVDYSQIQLRLLADVAGVATFRNTFNAGADIHEQTARKIFNIAPEVPVTKSQRRAAKTVNFSIIYGISSFGLAAQLGVSRDAAKQIIDAYMAGLPEVKKYIDETKQFATKNACVYTPWGRRIELPEIKNSRLKQYALRAAVNAPIQGFEADLMRLAMVEIARDIVAPAPDKIKLILQVHDEIIFECDENVANEFAKKIREKMENICKISVPLVAESNIGTKWDK
jgi:DNA polymerase-1